MTPRLLAGAVSLTIALASSVHAESPFAALSREKPSAAPSPIAREFPAPNLETARRLAIAALQDLGLALEAANGAASTISASRLDTHPLRLTVSITAKDEATVTAAITTDYAGTALADTRAAEAFFAAYEAALAPPPEID